MAFWRSFFWRLMALFLLASTMSWCFWVQQMSGSGAYMMSLQSQLGLTGDYGCGTFTTRLSCRLAVQKKNSSGSVTVFCAFLCPNSSSILNCQGRQSGTSLAQPCTFGRWVYEWGGLSCRLATSGRSSHALLYLASASCKCFSLLSCFSCSISSIAALLVLYGTGLATTWYLCWGGGVCWGDSNSLVVCFSFSTRESQLCMRYRFCVRLRAILRLMVLTNSSYFSLLCDLGTGLALNFACLCYFYYLCWFFSTICFSFWFLMLLGLLVDRRQSLPTRSVLRLTLLSDLTLRIFGLLCCYSSSLSSSGISLSVTGQQVKPLALKQSRNQSRSTYSGALCLMQSSTSATLLARSQLDFGRTRVLSFPLNTSEYLTLETSTLVAQQDRKWSTVLRRYIDLSSSTIRTGRCMQLARWVCSPIHRSMVGASGWMQPSMASTSSSRAIFSPILPVLTPSSNSTFFRGRFRLISGTSTAVASMQARLNLLARRMNCRTSTLSSRSISSSNNQRIFSQLSMSSTQRTCSCHSRTLIFLALTSRTAGQLIPESISEVCRQFSTSSGSLTGPDAPHCPPPDRCDPPPLPLPDASTSLLSTIPSECASLYPWQTSRMCRSALRALNSRILPSSL